MTRAIWGEVDGGNAAALRRLESPNGRRELQRQYVSQGRYGASVSSEVVPLPRNRVELKINIYEGKPARIIIKINSLTEAQIAE